MPRIRTIKPELWQDEKLAALPPLPRLVFLGLISMADDAGRLVDNVKSIDGFIFPETDDSAKESLGILARLSRILRYTSPNGQRCIQIVHWARHQKVDHPNKYVLPAPPAEVIEPVVVAPISLGSRESLAKSSRNPLATTSTPTSTPTSNSVLSEPADAVGEQRAEQGEPGHHFRSVLGLVISELYLGQRPAEDEVRRNASVLKALAQRWSYDDLAKIVHGLATQRSRGELGKVGPRQAVSLKWLHDGDPAVDPCQRALDAYYREDKPPPDRKRGGAVTNISDLLGRAS